MGSDDGEKGRSGDACGGGYKSVLLIHQGHVFAGIVKSLAHPYYAGTDRDMTMSIVVVGEVRP